MKLKGIYKKFFGADLPIDLVMFNIVTFMGLTGGLLALIFNLLNHVTTALTATVIAAIAVDCVCIYMANYKNHVRNSAIAVVFMVAVVLLPVMFFNTGGVNSGIVCWFSMGLVFIFLLLDGMDFLFMLLTDIAVIVGCYVIGYVHPEYIIPLESDKAVFIDVLESMFITVGAIGIIIKFQASIYNKLYSDVAVNNDDLLEKTLAAKRAERLAQTATKAKTNFLANMSHEIRTPINSIMGMDEMILRETTEKKVEEYALDIKTASQSLLSLINDILDISKIESGKLGIIEGEYEFMSLMHDILTNIGLRAKDKGLKLVCSIDKNIPSVLVGDDIRIKQILINILTNAIKYTPEGSITLTVDVKSTSGNSVELGFSVKDTGIGIKEEDKKKLFESFERLEMDRNRNIEGAGLGMAITQSLLNMMGTSLKVDSEYGKGSDFHFTLSQQVAEAEPIGDFETRLNNMTANYEYSASFEAPKAKFLVVDDNAMNRKVFIALLKESKVQVEEAESGKECLMMICKKHYDMIFLDHMMPELDGVETLKAMSTLEGNKCLGTPVIALTANAIAGAKEKYLSWGFHGFLPKPIIPAQLEKTIRDFLPEDLMKYYAKDETEQEKKDRVYKVELPDIEGVDWDYALLHFPDTGMVYQTAVDFSKSIDYEKNAISNLYDSLDGDFPLEDYRIKVHGVKSMANTIGATALGGLAKTCEYAAKENKIEKIRVLTPILLEEMDSMREKLSGLHDDADKPTMEDVDGLQALLEMLKMSLITHDSEQSDNIAGQIDSYSYEPEVQKEVDRLLLCVINFKEEEAIDIINSLQAKG
ncbi:MAG: response regulator [Pseudobutyrivibrio sp.]|nr:response regulator [Pseudobutyrivibrio sp.]